MMREGPGFIIRHGEAGPWRAWIAADLLDGLQGNPAPPVWTALRTLGELANCFPGGLDLIWNRPPAWFEDLSPLDRCGFWEALGGIGGLTLHFREGTAAEVPNGVFRGWIHSPEPPQGPLGEAWRHGAFGWIPDPPEHWKLPGLGRIPSADRGLPEVGESVPPGWLWGDVVIPVSALTHFNEEILLRQMEEIQGRIERSLGHRFSLGAWPSALPFQRRRCHWRIGVLGGAEYQLAGGDWERAAEHLQALLHRLERSLKSPLQVGPSLDLEASKALGAQAMREALPWRNALPLPPSPAVFTLGLGADFRRPTPLEARASLAPALAAILLDPPITLLRVPAAPTDSAARHFTASLGHAAAIRWLPPDLVPPAPWDPEQPWATPSGFPLPTMPGYGLQRTLFEGWAD
jgi:hypothetical protein